MKEMRRKVESINEVRMEAMGLYRRQQRDDRGGGAELKAEAVRAKTN